MQPLIPAEGTTEGSSASAAEDAPPPPAAPVAHRPPTVAPKPRAKSMQSTVATCVGLVVVGVVAVVSRDGAIIGAVSLAVSNILSNLSQRHTAADLHSSTPADPRGRSDS